jgi:hypothetical protein
MKAAARLLLILALVAPSFASAQAQAAPAPTCRLFASATIVNYNTKVRLDWDSRNATGGYLTDVGAISPDGYAYVVPGKNTTYAASFTGPGGTIVCRVAVAVRSGGPGSSYGGGVVNIDGTADYQSTSIDTTGHPINTTSHPIDTTAHPIDTNKPVNTNVPVNLNGTVNLGGNVTLPTAPSVVPGATAQNSGSSRGIVPEECRGDRTIANCDLCSLAQMGQNLANFLLGVSIPAAALLFAWAGALYFSSRGNPGQIERAHKVFRSVVIGFAIAISAWLLVITAMNMLIHGKDFSGWNWNELRCADTRMARKYNMTLKAYLGSSLGFLSVSGTNSGSDAVNGGGSGSGGGYASMVAQLDRFKLECENGTQASCAKFDTLNETLTRLDAQQDQLQDECDDGVQSSCIKLETALNGPGASSVNYNYTSEQNVWLSACRQGDVQSCRSFSASTGSGELGVRIAAATHQYMNTDTSSGPGGGNVACAWAVNNILKESGIAPVDGNSVYFMQEQLRNGRGTLVGTNSNLANTQQGDIVVWKTSTMSHVGICENDGCTRVASNSSANARFMNITSASFNGKSTSNIYRVNN